MDRGEVVAVFVPQSWHRSDAAVLLFYADGIVTREDDDEPLTPTQVAGNCAERVVRPKPWKRKRASEGQ